MSGPSKGDAVEVANKAQLVEFAESGNKPPEKWRIGTEHEKFGFTLDRHEPLPYEGSQGIQAMLEGLLLFIILWWFSAKNRPRAAVSGLFLLGYGCFRFIAEFFRVPDPQYGYLAFDWFTMGQLLCVPMIIAGLLMMIWAYQRKT